jgi:hypothetical protein
MKRADIACGLGNDLDEAEGAAYEDLAVGKIGDQRAQSRASSRPLSTSSSRRAWIRSQSAGAAKLASSAPKIASAALRDPWITMTLRTSRAWRVSPCRRSARSRIIAMIGVMPLPPPTSRSFGATGASSMKSPAGVPSPTTAPRRSWWSAVDARPPGMRRTVIAIRRAPGAAPPDEIE